MEQYREDSRPKSLQTSYNLNKVAQRQDIKNTGGNQGGAPYKYPCYYKQKINQMRWKHMDLRVDHHLTAQMSSF